MLRLLAASSALALADAHGALVTPRSRNAVDFEEITNNASAGIHNVWAQCSNITGAPCNNGQATYWYSQGCFIGCDECDHVSGRRQTDLCNSGFVGQLPDHAISVNRDQVRDSEYDIYRHNPWRAPGFAPVADACGLAGGTPWASMAPEEGQYVNTTHARHGMKGTSLPPLDTGTVWTAGGEEPVVFAVKFNHGGGYSYRLCPADEELTEACFQKHPLDFAPKQALLFPNGSTLDVSASAVFVDEGTSPAGSMWTRVALSAAGLGPRCACDLDNDYNPGDFSCGCKMGEQVDSCVTAGNCSLGHCEPCPETAGSDCSRCDNPPIHPWGRSSFPQPCDDACLAESPSVLDHVIVPETIKPGKYVLGFRYDCDSTAQVWSNCADITIVAA